jgi:hypothetical protein
LGDYHNLIYFVQVGKDGPIKIGYTANLSNRLSTLKTNNVEEMSLLQVLNGNKDFEKKFHKLFEKERIRGEWFYPSKRLLAVLAAIGSAKEQNKNLETEMEKFIQKDATVRTHYQTVTTGVLIPAAQALLTGVWLGISAGVIAYFLGTDGWRVGFISFVLCSTFCWLYLMRRWMSLVWQIEQWLQTDLTGDEIVGEPVIEQTIKHQIEAIVKEGNKTSIIDLPGDPGKLSLLARGLIIKELVLTEDVWVNKGPFTLSEFRKLRNVMEKRKLIRLKNPKSHRPGFILTDKGREVLLSIIENEAKLQRSQNIATTTLPAMAD